MPRNSRTTIKEARREAMTAIPQGDYIWLSGRQAKVLQEFQIRYGLPVAERTIDLSAVVRGLHDLIARNAHRIRPVADTADDDPDVDAPAGSSPALERLRAAKADREEMLRDIMRGDLAKVEEVSAALAILATRLRRAGETLQRHYGNDAADLLNDALNESMGLIRRKLAPPATAAQAVSLIGEIEEDAEREVVKRKRRAKVKT